MATTAGFPIIGTSTVWSEWNNFGSGAWNMWFMAPYGEWIYAAFVKSNVAYFKKINIGGSNGDYPMTTWEFEASLLNTPDKVFPYEKNEGYPNGSMNMGVIRGTTPKLYVVGRQGSGLVGEAKIEYFPLADDFDKGAAYTVPLDAAGDPMEINRICGLEVDPGTAIYLVTNNNGAYQFTLWRYAYTWDDGEHSATATKALSPTSAAGYMEDNTAARIRGIGIAPDGNVLVFANTGESSTECKVFKFDKTTLAYMGTTSWLPSLSASTWANLVKYGEVYLFFRSLDSTSSSDWRTAVYYDRATGLPDATKSNFIINDNLTIFASDDAVELSYHARDAFNVAVVGANTKFYIAAEDPDDETTWTDRVGGIQAASGATFFDADGVPEATSVVTVTDGDGIATAWYKPMRSGSGTERDAIAIKCPSES